jgi:hypothetical protein
LPGTGVDGVPRGAYDTTPIEVEPLASGTQAGGSFAAQSTRLKSSCLQPQLLPHPARIADLAGEDQAGNLYPISMILVPTANLYASRS